MDSSHSESALTRNAYFDPLLECLCIISRLFNKPQAPDGLVAGLPLKKNRLTPTLFERAAERAGFSSRTLRYDLGHINPHTLPIVLLLKNDRACVLTKIDHQEAQIIVPESGDGIETISLEDLSQIFLGHAIYLKPHFKFEARAQDYLTERKHSWFWSTVWRYKDNYKRVMFGTLFINLFSLITSLYSMNVYDRVIPNNATDTLWVLTSGVLIIYAFDFALKMVRAYLIDISGKKADVLLSGMLYQHAMNIKMEHRPQSVGSFANLFQNYEGLREFFTSTTMSLVVDLPFCLVFLGFTAVIGSWLVVIPLCFIPLVAVSSWWVERHSRHHMEVIQSANLQKNALLIETLANLETIKATSAQGLLQGRWEKFISMASSALIQSKLTTNLGSNISSFLVQFESVAMICFGVYLIKAGQLSMGGLIACNILASRAVTPIVQLAALMSRYEMSKLGLESLNKFMELDEDRGEQKNYVFREDLKGGIEFRDVTFTYPKQKIPAIKNISFEIKSGERVGIIGRIGSGKSTLEKLILNLYAPQEGQILVDGTDIAQLDPAMLRRHIGYVGQDSSLFYGTIRDNILLSAPWSNDEAFLRAAKIAGVDRFVSKHPAGYDMPVGERGEMISGGQRQSIILARALLPDPKILLLDEPTSAMDTMAERDFIHSIAKYCFDKTIILITHRLSLLQLVERVLVIDNAQLVTDGPRDAILEAFKLQAQTASDDV